ncbi:hypothetical protein L7F22_049330, partial [Adiantum nelumboides]|nr:hypothetical protein [Adiantum nelumboides]
MKSKQQVGDQKHEPIVLATSVGFLHPVTDAIAAAQGNSCFILDTPDDTKLDFTERI